MLAHSVPPGYRRPKKPEPKIDANHDWIVEVLKSDMNMPCKQRHSAKMIWDRLREKHNFDGGYTVVKEAVAELKFLKQEVFVPLSHSPDEAQMGFGHALVNFDEELKKRPFFVISLAQSDAFFVQVIDRPAPSFLDSPAPGGRPVRLKWNTRFRSELCGRDSVSHKPARTSQRRGGLQPGKKHARPPSFSPASRPRSSF